jgi:pilus assembly protein CpaE
MSTLVLATRDVDFEARVRDEYAGTLNGDLTYWHENLPLGDDVPRTVEDLAARATVVALGPDLPIEAALELTAAFDRAHPEVSVVIIATPTADLMRAALHAGARDVIAADTGPGEIRAAFERAEEAAEARRARIDTSDGPDTDTAKVMAILCPKGGAGKTTTATNLAVGLAQVAPHEVVIVDLDLQFGDVAAALRLEPEHTICDVVRLADTLDAAGLKAYLTPHQSNLYALCAPASPGEADDLTAEQIHAVLGLLAQSFRYVVIDTAAGLDEAAIAGIEHATDFILLSATDVPSVRNTRKEVEALRVISKPSQRWHFVLNRADARTGLNLNAIEMAVGLSVDVAIPSSRAVPVSMNQGMPVIASDPKAAVALAMAQLVRRVSPGASEQGPDLSDEPRRKKVKVKR